MQELTKTPRIRARKVQLRFLGPPGKRGEAVAALNALGFVDVSDSVPWRECFPYSDEQLPGIALTGARGKEGLTQRELAELTGIPQRHISEMENGKRPIGKEVAKKLGKALNISYKAFL
jgi:DNA-binding XRE family transcriptional regulator